MSTEPTFALLDSTRPPTGALWRGRLVSAAAHAAVLLAVSGLLHHAAVTATYKLPGTAHGVMQLTYYAPGSPERATSTLAVKQEQKPLPSLRAAAAASPRSQIASLDAQSGIGLAQQSGLGDGDISIALQKYFPYPRPDLALLAPGTKGDVVLNAVIDEQGKIADLTLIKGLGPSIDNTVIATVKQWTYSPAMKNGSAVRSEQELHFHYEKS